MRTTRALGAWMLAALWGCGAGGTEVVDPDAGDPFVRDTGAALDRGVVALDTGTIPEDVQGGFDAGPPMDADMDAAGGFRLDVPPVDARVRDVQPNFDAFFADNPPPQYCGPDGSTDAGPPPELPGGTPECPDDLNREGCECLQIGARRPCWPGLRANRNRGICRDGMTTCQPYDELSGRWGPCEGYQLPAPGVRFGPSSCQCFSAGRWELLNTSPCFVTYGQGAGATLYAVSTYLDGQNRAQCPTLSASQPPPPRPQAGTHFSPNFLTVDCTGQFELCYVIRAGDATRPSPSDCVVARTCTMAWYPEANQRRELPPLPAWTGSDPACARRFVDGGGYGEMTVRGRSSECQAIDDGMGGEYVFNRVTYCPSRCNTMPTLPECANCGNGGSGNF